MVGFVILVLFLDLVRRLYEGDLLYSQLAIFVWDGVVVGLVVGLAGIGLSMTYSILNFANFAHGDYLTSGAFLGWGVTYLLVGYGSAPLGKLLLVGTGGSVSGAQLGISVLQTPLAVVFGLVFAAAATIILTLVIDRLVYRPMRDYGSISLLITSVGVSFALRYLVAFVFGTSNRGTTPIIPTWSVPVIDGTVPVNIHEVALVSVAVVLMLFVHFILQYTKLGKSMRAMADNEDLARITGIPTERVVRWTWILGGGLAGIAGYLIVLERGNISYQFGWLLILLIFAAVILGGIGSIYGAMVGGIVIGVAQNLSLVWLPSGDFTLQTAFILMILILVFYPEGIYRGRATA